LQAGGHRFDSVHLHHRANAQSALVAGATAALLRRESAEQVARSRRCLFLRGAALAVADATAGAAGHERRVASFSLGLGEEDLPSTSVDGCFVVFDRVKREYLSSMMTKVRQAASVECLPSSVICSGEEPKLLAAGLRAGRLEASGECLHARRVVLRGLSLRATGLAIKR
jgi:hypothetical protein